MSFTVDYHKLHSGSLIRMGYAKYVCIGFSMNGFTNNMLCVSITKDKVTKEDIMEKLSQPIIQMGFYFVSAVYIVDIDYDFMDLSALLLTYNILHHTNYSDTIPYPIVKVKNIEKGHTYSDFTGCFGSDSVYISVDKHKLMSYEMHESREKWDNRYDGDSKMVCVFDDYNYRYIQAMNCPLLLLK